MRRRVLNEAAMVACELVLREAGSLALPGDLDLSLDLDGVSVEVFSRLGNEFVVVLVGGFGLHRPDATEDAEEVQVAHLRFQFGYFDGNHDQAAQAGGHLSAWAAERTPLRLTVAADRMPVLMEDWANALVLCRPKRPGHVVSAED